MREVSKRESLLMAKISEGVPWITNGSSTSFFVQPVNRIARIKREIYIDFMTIHYKDYSEALSKNMPKRPYVV